MKKQLDTRVRFGMELYTENLLSSAWLYNLCIWEILPRKEYRNKIRKTRTGP